MNGFLCTVFMHGFYARFLCTVSICLPELADNKNYFVIIIHNKIMAVYKIWIQTIILSLRQRVKTEIHPNFGVCIEELIFQDYVISNFL